MEITLSDDRLFYEPGQLVAGKLRISRPEFTARQMTVGLVGVAKVNWSETSPNIYGIDRAVIIPPPVSFMDMKKFLDLVNDVSGQYPTTTVQKVTFELKLPDSGIPASYQGDGGSIEYKLIARAIGDDGQELNDEREIGVLSPIKDDLMVSVMNRACKQFGLVSLGSGEITVTAFLARKGYFAGETMDLIVDIANQSSAESTPRVTLYQTEVLMCGQRHRASQTALTEEVVGKCVAKHTNERQFIPIAIPKDAALSIKSDLIVVKYMIHVTLDIPHAFDIHVNLPVVVTTQSALNLPNQ